MLDTLYQFGQHLSKDGSRLEFDDCIAAPPVDEKEKAKGLEFLVAEIIFDLDAGTFRLNDKPRVFDASDKTARWSPYNLRCVKNLGANAKNVYPTVDPRKHFDQWKKSFFGKEDKNGNKPTAPELSYSIQKDFPDLAETPVCRAAAAIFKMRENFEATFPEWKKVTEALSWGEKSRVVMLFASVVSTELECLEPVPVAKLDGFDAFVRRRFLQKNSGEENSRERKGDEPKTCYVTGKQSTDVDEPAFGSRYNLNKMFVTTTKNYASGFDDKAFSKNYQVSGEAQTFLERGSKYVLDNLKIQIAGVDHCILPQFRGGQEIDLEGRVPHLKSKSELLFSMHKKDQFIGFAHDVRSISEGEIYWLTFLGYETDETKSKYFKTINLIKDVSKTHFETVIKVLGDVDGEMEEIAGKQWTDTMTYGKDKPPSAFNFYTIYSLIPVRKAKEKRNAALALFKAILERRPIAREALFGHFAELVQCHRFERYAGYNILPNSNFDFATRDAVFQYHAFLNFLKKIKLLDMDAKTTQDWAAELLEIETAITDFFTRMEYSPSQKAMFYLGRVLHKVAIAQYKAKHKQKPVLNKVNYNGMDTRSIRRLAEDLFDKCRQYQILTKENEGYFTNFWGTFKEANWKTNPEEALFYLLSGYSFRTSKDRKEDPENSETETSTTESEN
jgi:CRISPR-associated protein Csh1